MSIEIDWHALTSGPDGEALAESIRSFIHDRFQRVTLPRFIRSVQVHAFDFGATPPELELKDVCDPLPDFYEGDDEDGSDEGDDDDEGDGRNQAKVRDHGPSESPGRPPHHSTTHRGRPADAIDATPSPVASSARQQTNPHTGSPLPRPERTLRPPATTGGGSDLPSAFSLRSSTPGIPGGTSNVNNYFHLPLSAGLNGAQTPFAAVAGAHGWPDRYQQQSFSSMQDANQHHQQQHYFGQQHSRGNAATSSSPPLPPPLSTAAHELPDNRHRRNSSMLQGMTSSPLRPEDAPASPQQSTSSTAPGGPDVAPNDIQIVAHLRYSGDVKLTLTADILLDYPMPSFVGIPLQLRVTGLTFDGVAILAYIRRRAHFCFLAPEDADALIGGGQESYPPDEAHASSDTTTGPGLASDEHGQNQTSQQQQQQHQPQKAGGLFQHIQVESEIGHHDGSSVGGQKPALKNVGKVERFVLDQVRRIFEAEFVYPSFWTLLV